MEEYEVFSDNKVEPISKHQVVDTVDDEPWYIVVVGFTHDDGQVKEYSVFVRSSQLSNVETTYAFVNAGNRQRSSIRLEGISTKTKREIIWWLPATSTINFMRAVKLKGTPDDE